jgi:hypothetical protein
VVAHGIVTDGEFGYPVEVHPSAVRATAGGPRQPLQVVATVGIVPEPCLELANGRGVVRTAARVFVHAPPTTAVRRLRSNGEPRTPFQGAL